MREFDPINVYPPPSVPRVVSPNLRTIHNRIIASFRDKEFFDGDRNNGYGGYKYDGRWVPIAKNMCEVYGLKDHSTILQIQSEKGFLLSDFKNLNSSFTVYGLENSAYAIDSTLENVKPNIKLGRYTELPFPDQSMDLIIAIGVVYAQTMEDALTVLKEIKRVCRGKSFINLASYESEEDYWLFKDWTLLGTLLLKKEEWLEVLKAANYQGDYAFTNSKKLNLIRKKD